MEYCMVARALKPSLCRELASKSTQQAFLEDIWCSNSNNGVVSSEDFSVDCFLDFSSGEFKENYNFQELQVEEDEEEEEEEEKDSVSVSSQDNNSNFSNFSDSFLTNQLSVPVDELAELEWVSQVVDDSSSEFPVFYPLKTDNNHVKNRIQSQSKSHPVLTRPSCLFPTRIPAKARSKRTRPTSRTWSIGSSLTDSSSSLSSSSTTSSSASTPCTVFTQTIDSLPGFSEPPVKKQKKKTTVQTGGMMGSTQFQRRCSHCQVQKTPQWRTGPLGAKTLCNACGVRYKSGRLFPEYRPACSPTFSVDVHSNSHRKVLEIRKKKEMTGPESGSNQMVSSF